jgi:hypothetical protein
VKLGREFLMQRWEEMQKAAELTPNPVPASGDA